MSPEQEQDPYTIWNVSVTITDLLRAPNKQAAIDGLLQRLALRDKDVEVTATDAFESDDQFAPDAPGAPYEVPHAAAARL